MNTKRTNTGAMIGGAILIGVGLLALIAQFFPGGWGNLWPFFIIGPGLLFFVGMFLGGKSAGPMAIPGSIITMIGLVLFYQNLTGHWESWAYAWTLILVAIGAGIYISGSWSANAAQRRSGWDLTKAGLILFVIFGSFFELVFSGFRRDFLQVVFPGLLILVGIYLILSRSGLWKPRQLAVPEQPVSVVKEPPVMESLEQPVEPTPAEPVSKQEEPSQPETGSEG